MSDNSEPSPASGTDDAPPPSGSDAASAAAPSALAPPFDALEAHLDELVLVLRHTGKQDKPVLPVVLLPPGDPPPFARELLGKHVRSAVLSRSALHAFVVHLSTAGEAAKPDAPSEPHGTIELSLKSSTDTWAGVRSPGDITALTDTLMSAMGPDDTAAREAVLALRRQLP